MEQKQFIDKLDELNEAYYKRFCDLKENFSLLPVEAYKAIAAAITKQYERDYKLLDGEEGLDTDKHIEELEKERAEQLGELQLIREKCIEEINAEREKELKEIENAREKQREEIEVEHTKALKELKLTKTKLLGEIEAQRFKQEEELKLLKAVVEAENTVKRATVIPKDLPRRWWQRYARPNYAKQLVEQVAEMDIDKYYDDREAEIVQREAEEEGVGYYITELLEELPRPRGRRARKKWSKGLDILKRRLLSLLPEEVEEEDNEEPEEEEEQQQEPTKKERQKRRKAIKAQLQQAKRKPTEAQESKDEQEPKEEKEVPQNNAQTAQKGFGDETPPE